MKHMHAHSRKIFLGVILILSLLNACKKDQDVIGYSAPSTEKSFNPDRYDAYVIDTWYKLMLKLTVETPVHTPPVAARSFGYAGIALYESLVDNMHLGHHSLVGQ